MILHSEFADGFQFPKIKRRFGIFFFVAEIFNKYRNYTFFMRHPLEIIKQRQKGANVSVGQISFFLASLWV